jgi:uncharacterized repeat protein (TIGR01451 family)
MNLLTRHHPARLVLLFPLVAALLILGGQAAVAQSGADLDVSISGDRTVRYSENITYTITATNIGDETATGVQLEGWVPDWFNFVSMDCLGGTPRLHQLRVRLSGSGPGRERQHDDHRRGLLRGAAHVRTCLSVRHERRQSSQQRRQHQGQLHRAATLTSGEIPANANQRPGYADGLRHHHDDGGHPRRRLAPMVTEADCGIDLPQLITGK